MTQYHVFHRTWWAENQAWPDGLEPQAGEKHTIAHVYTEQAARELCKDYNANNEPGRLSDKAEYELA